MSDDSSVPFLEDDQEKNAFIEEHQKIISTRRDGWPSRKALILHIILIAVYTMVFLVDTSYKESSNCLPLVWSPASAATKWEVRTVDGFRPDEIYTHHPSPEVDLAWSQLLENSNFRINPDEIARLGLESLPLADGSGYLASLGVYHQLHCLKRIQRWMYRDHYYPNLTEGQEKDRFDHMAHCVELLRQATVCKADTSITTFRWLRDEQGHGVKPSPKMGMMHECIDWENLQDWIEPRRLDLYDKSVLGEPPSLS